MRNRVEWAGFTFSGLASLPQQFSISSYLQAAQRNDPAAVESLTALCAFLTEAGAAHIPLIVCDCDAPGSGESVIAPEGRGGALIHKYGQPVSVNPDIITALWKHLDHWLQKVVPIAEQAGVRLAFSTKNITDGWLDSIEAMQHLLEIIPSPCVGLNSRQGVLTQTLGSNIPTAIRHFCAQKKIFLVEVANLRSNPSHVVEAFLDEPMPEVMPDTAAMLHLLQVYHASDYEGTVQPATPPGLVGDTAWGHKGQAFNLGYIRSLLQVLEHA